MAKRKKSRKVSHRRRRRVSGIGAINMTNVLTQVAGIAAGAAGASILAKTVFPTLDAKIKSAVQIGAGVAVPMFLKSELGKSVGAGMIAVGSIGLLQSFNVISGIGADDALLLPVSISGDDSLSVVAGTEDDEMIAGDDDLSVLAGIDEDGY